MKELKCWAGRRKECVATWSIADDEAVRLESTNEVFHCPKGHPQTWWDNQYRPEWEDVARARKLIALDDDMTRMGAMVRTAVGEMRQTILLEVSGRYHSDAAAERRRQEDAVADAVKKAEKPLNARIDSLLQEVQRLGAENSRLLAIVSPRKRKARR